MDGGHLLLIIFLWGWPNCLCLLMESPGAPDLSCVYPGRYHHVLSHFTHVIPIPINLLLTPNRRTQVNKPEAERCLSLAKGFMNSGNYVKAIKFFQKSQRLYPLPGVNGLIERCNNEMRKASQPQQPRRQSGAEEARARRESGSGGDGREYTDENKRLVRETIAASKSRSEAHYKVLGIPKSASAAEIKKAYRKKSIKLHPDKNPAPGADEAFKAINLANATLSDPQKRDIYDRYGDEDPDSNSGAAAQNPFANMRRRQGGGQGDVDPEDLFRMFFGGPMGGMGGGMGGPGFRMYTSGFGPGMGGGFHQGGRARRREGDRNGGNDGAGGLLQLLPLLFFVLLSFLSYGEEGGGGTAGGGQYFSLTHKHPFTHSMETKVRGVVKDIPYFVSDSFLRTYNRDPYKLAQVERMVESAYDSYLQAECRNQRRHKRQLQQRADNFRGGKDEKDRLVDDAVAFELSRCHEHEDLFSRKRR